MENFVPPAAEDKSDERVLSDIEVYGWHVLHIEDEEGTAPDFFFTIGLYYHFAHPELLIMGLRREPALAILNSAGNAIRSGLHYESGARYGDLVENYPLVFIPIAPDNYEEHLGYAIWFYRNLPAPFPALQCIWPDRGGRFPWERGYDQAFSKLQPLLGPPPN